MFATLADVNAEVGNYFHFNPVGGWHGPKVNGE